MDALTAVLDIGKTHAKLLLLDAEGEPVDHWRTASRSIAGALGYPALDHEGLQAWLRATLAALGKRRSRLARLVVTTHGAAFAGLAGNALALPVADYEFAGFDQRPADWPQQQDGFAATASPLLPRGLNAAVQLDWLERHHPEACARVDGWLPYPQFWAWWLCGTRASELSSLGCHTLLWRPAEARFSELAARRGWAARFAPLRRAWEVLGTIRPGLARELGLPAGLQIHCGVHDSNACLARYLRAWPRMTLVSSGTWTVVMAPGAAATGLDPGRDFMANVSVRGEAVPTGRFMGGREIEMLCAGAEPSLADPAVLASLLERGVQVLPGLGALGGPFAAQRGGILQPGGPVALAEIATRFTPVERATLAALHCAYSSAWVIHRLGASPPVAVDGPLAANPVYCAVLAALLPRDAVHASVDPVEGTARGAWVLSQWTRQVELPPRVVIVAGSALDERIRAHHRRWNELVDAAG